MANEINILRSNVNDILKVESSKEKEKKTSSVLLETFRRLRNGNPKELLQQQIKRILSNFNDNELGDIAKSENKCNDADLLLFIRFLLSLKIDFDGKKKLQEQYDRVDIDLIQSKQGQNAQAEPIKKSTATTRAEAIKAAQKIIEEQRGAKLSEQEQNTVKQTGKLGYTEFLKQQSNPQQKEKIEEVRKKAGISEKASDTQDKNVSEMLKQTDKSVKQGEQSLFDKQVQAKTEDIKHKFMTLGGLLETPEEKAQRQKSKDYQGIDESTIEALKEDLEGRKEFRDLLIELFQKQNETISQVVDQPVDTVQVTEPKIESVQVTEPKIESVPIVQPVKQDSTAKPVEEESLSLLEQIAQGQIDNNKEEEIEPEKQPEVEKEIKIIEKKQDSLITQIKKDIAPNIAKIKELFNDILGKKNEDRRSAEEINKQIDAQNIADDAAEKAEEANLLSEENNKLVKHSDENLQRIADAVTKVEPKDKKNEKDKEEDKSTASPIQSAVGDAIVDKAGDAAVNYGKKAMMGASAGAAGLAVMGVAAVGAGYAIDKYGREAMEATDDESKTIYDLAKSQKKLEKENRAEYEKLKEIGGDEFKAEWAKKQQELKSGDIDAYKRAILTKKELTRLKQKYKKSEVKQIKPEEKQTEQPIKPEEKQTEQPIKPEEKQTEQPTENAKQIATIDKDISIKQEEVSKVEKINEKDDKISDDTDTSKQTATKISTNQEVIKNVIKKIEPEVIPAQIKHEDKNIKADMTKAQEKNDEIEEARHNEIVQHLKAIAKNAQQTTDAVISSRTVVENNVMTATNSMHVTTNMSNYFGR